MHAVVSGWLLGEASGANRRLLALLACLGQQRSGDERITVLHRPDFVTPSLGGIEWQPIGIPAAPTWRRVVAERRWLAARLRALHATVYDHGFLPLPRLSIPSCLLVHDLRAVDGLTRWPRWLATTALRRSCAHATAIVTPSQWTAARVRAIAPDAAAAVVVPNGVDQPATDVGPPAAAMPPNGYLLHVGHVEPRKNLAVVVRALAMLPANERPELWLAGRDAGSMASLQQLAADLGCVQQLRCLGAVRDDELPALYAHARAVVVPSLHEGFGLCALEALAHGRNVLASDRSALPETIGPHGQLLPADDAAAWSNAIAQPTATDEQHAARREWANRFRWDDSATRLLDLWRRLHRR